jgi:hypothetical protein
MNPGTTAPSMVFGAGAVSGKLSAAIFLPWRLAIDQISSASMSRQSYRVQNTSPPRSSARMKSNTPWAPGPLPVMIEVQAGGVSGLGVERSLVRAPFFISPARKGMVTPSPGSSRVISSSTV